tara:strand:- start:219 stop:479 length:261 start_codon:yes stop_codon:yes gene_type:complete
MNIKINYVELELGDGHVAHLSTDQIHDLYDKIGELINKNDHNSINKPNFKISYGSAFEAPAGFVASDFKDGVWSKDHDDYNENESE